MDAGRIHFPCIANVLVHDRTLAVTEWCLNTVFYDLASQAIAQG